MPRSTRPARALGVVVGAVGLATLASAPRAAAAAAGRGGRSPDAQIVRVLGARQAVQGVLTVVRPQSSTVGLAAAGDAAHAVSMVAVALAVPRYRRPALISALMAMTSAALGAVIVSARRTA